MSMISKIYRKDGILGFGKGFSAAFYGGAIYGFAYFTVYKILKGHFKEFFGDTIDMTLCYFLASFTAECICLLVKLPYDLIKCRLQSVNDRF